MKARLATDNSSHRGLYSPIYKHDIFNLLSLSCILTIDAAYLLLIWAEKNSVSRRPFCIPNPWSSLSDACVVDANNCLFLVLFYAIELYLVVDIIWVWNVPKCVPSDPMNIILHHIITIATILLPFCLRQFYYYLPLVLLVEWNTPCLIARRNVVRTEASLSAYKVLDVLFYGTWLIFRLIGFPVCTYCLVVDYIHYSRDENIMNYMNIMLLAPCCLGILSALSFWWTFQLLSKKKST
jgi:hypothetical protein